MKKDNFNIKGVDITNIKVGDIVNKVIYSKFTDSNDEWKKISVEDTETADWKVTEITKINDKYVKLTLKYTEPIQGISKKWFPTTKIVFDLNGVSKTQYMISYSLKYVITNLK